MAVQPMNHNLPRMTSGELGSDALTKHVHQHPKTSRRICNDSNSIPDEIEGDGWITIYPRPLEVEAEGS